MVAICEKVAAVGWKKGCNWTKNVCIWTKYSDTMYLKKICEKLLQYFGILIRKWIWEYQTSIIQIEKCICGFYSAICVLWVDTLK